MLLCSTCGALSRWGVMVLAVGSWRSCTRADACAFRALAISGLGGWGRSGLAGALAGGGGEAKLVQAQHLGGGAVGPQRVFQGDHHPLAVAAVLHVDEVDDDDAAEVAQADLAHDLLDGIPVGLDDGGFPAGGG